MNTNTQTNEISDYFFTQGELWTGLLNYFDNEEEAEKALKDNYCGEYESLADYAYTHTQNTIEIPRHIKFYIDYEKMGRDMEIRDIFTIETRHGKLHVFRSL